MLDSARELREHLFLTGLAVVVGAGTVALLGSWAWYTALDAVEDFLAARRGELEPRAISKSSAEDESAAFEMSVDCGPLAPEE